MSPRLLAGSLAMAAFAVTGCVDEPNLGSTAGVSFEEFKARTYREPGTGLFILDWDTPVSGDEELRKVWEATQQGALAVYTENGADIKWDATQKRNLTYCVSNAFGANKQMVVDAMRAASDSGWELFADVNFIYVPAQDGNCTSSNPNVLFDVNPVSSGGQYLARAFFPNSPRVERNVLVDNVSFQPGGLGGVPFTNVIAHELGHALGFRHEHIRPEANAAECVEDNQFRGLTTYDAASVMHYPQCNGTNANLSFTQRDQQGVVALYGAPGTNTSPMAQINAPQDGATVGASFEVEASIVDADLIVAELFVDGTLVDTLDAAPFTFQVTNLGLGEHILEIVATDAMGQETRRELSVTVSANGGGTGTGNGEQPNGYGETVSGGCSATGSGSGAGLVIVLALGAVVGRRRRRQG